MTAPKPDPDRMQRAFHAAEMEMAYADSVWDNEPTLDEFILYIGRYANVAAEQTTTGNPKKALHTLRKIAGLAIKAMMRHGVFFR